MPLLKIIIDPSETGFFNSMDPKKCPIAKGLIAYGFSGVHVYENKWSGLKWGFIPVGGKIPIYSREKNNRIAGYQQKDFTVILVELLYFYRGD